MHDRIEGFRTAVAALILGLWLCAAAAPQPRAPISAGAVPESVNEIEPAEPRGGEAQEPAQPPVDAGVDADPDGQSERSPQGAVRRYLETCRAGEYAEAARYLDLGSIPPAQRAERGPRLARQLKLVLDQTLWIDLEALSAEPRGIVDDGLPPDLERLDTIPKTRSGPVEVLIQRTRDGNLWRFSSATVARIPALYDEFGYGRLVDFLPDRFFAVRFLEVQLWQWIGLLVLVFVAYLSSWILTRLGYAVLRPLVGRTKTTIDDQLLALTVKPVRFGVGLLVVGAASSLLHLAVPAHEFLQGLVKGLAVFAVAWLLLRMVDVATGVLRDQLERDGKRSAVAVLPLGEKAIKVVLLSFAFIALLQNLGINVTGLIAGLGVGGLAVALAAQKTVENLFGGVSLIVDQPVRVGDFCRFGDKVGTVEDVGMRTTRVRTLDRTVVSIPNAEFAHMQLENFALRDKIRFFTKLGLRYETTADQLRWVLAELKRLLVAHPKIEPDPARIRFIGYGDYSLDLEIFAYVRTPDFNEYLAIQEDLLLRIMDIVDESGTGFAFPSTTTYFARDGGKDRARTEAAEARVRALREAGRLPFPDDAPERIAEIEDSIEYPPKGSALAGR